MNASNWMLGDFNGNRFIEVNERRWDKSTVAMCDYVLVNGVKFVNEKKVHEDRVRRLEFTTCKCGEEIERPAGICPSCGRMVVE